MMDERKCPELGAALPSDAAEGMCVACLLKVGLPGGQSISESGPSGTVTLDLLPTKTVFTAFAQFIGTPAYMSPKQAKLGGLDVDTRSDICSLGVLLSPGSVSCMSP